jgi:pimeloyl-ACP methyl ester carboxylesterase
VNSAARRSFAAIAGDRTESVAATAPPADPATIAQASRASQTERWTTPRRYRPGGPYARRRMTDFPHVEGVEHRFVEAGGVRLHVAEAGAGPPLLLVHGWPQHWYEWRGLVAELAGERRLIMPDLRGFGWSDAPPGPIEPEVFVRDLLALLDVLGLDQVDVAGHDWGGFSSLLLSARHPERVRRLLAISTPHPWLKVTPQLALESWRAWYAVLFAGGLMEHDGARLAAWFIRREGVPAREAEVFAARLRAPGRASATTRLYRAYLSTLASTVRGGPAEPRSTVPTLLMIGARDMAVTPKLAAGFEQGGEDMRTEVLPGAGHFIPDTHPQVVAARVRSHLG